MVQDFSSPDHAASERAVSLSNLSAALEGRMGNPERAVKTRSKAPNSWKKSRRLRMPRTFVHPTERMDLTDAFDDGPPPAYNIDDTYAKFGKDIGPTAVSHKTVALTPEPLLCFGPLSRKVTAAIKPRSIWRRLLDWWERP